jgi:hypothetical protein
VKPETDQRLSDHISIGVLTRVFPPDLVDRIVKEAGRTEQRQRLLPARVVVYYVLGLALFSQCAYEEVMRMLVEGLSWEGGWASAWNVPTKAALFKARTRLGPEPIEALYRECAVPLATKRTKGSFYKSWRLMGIDGTCLDVADTAANDLAFGRPGSARENRSGAFPQIRLVGLAECGTHAIIDVVVGKYTDAERQLARGLFGSFRSGMLVLADRGFFSFELWKSARETGADLLCGASVTAPSSLRSTRAKRTAATAPTPCRCASSSTNSNRLRSHQVNKTRPTGSSPPSSTPKEPPPLSLPLSTHNVGSSSQHSTSSRPTNEAHAWCCAPRCPTASPKRPTDTCACTTPSAGSCTRSPKVPAPTPTG